MIVYLIAFYILGWVTFAFSIADFGRYSITLLYLAAVPFCLRLTQRSVCFLAFPIASSICAMLVAVFEGGDPRTWSNGAQQFLAIVFAAGVAAVDWRRYLDAFSKILVAFGVPIVAYGGYQMMARVGHRAYAFLPVTNQQEYATGGLQRGWEKPMFPRASSIFVEPSEFGYFCLWLGVFGLCARNPRVRVASFALAAAGTLFSQSLSGVLGMLILFAVHLFTNPIRLRQIQQFAVILVIATIALSIIPQLLPEPFASFSRRIQQAFALDNRADSDRVNHIPQNWRTFCESPIWGKGLAQVPIDDDQNGTSISYSLALMERGLVGTVLFFVPWVLVSIRCLRMRTDDPGRPAALLLTALNFYCFATFATMYYLPFWFSLGVTASLTLNTAKREGPAPVRGAGPYDSYGGIGLEALDAHSGFRSS